MFKVQISDRTHSCSDHAVLSGISRNSSGYEYGIALAKALAPTIQAKANAMATVTDDNGSVIHRLAIVPKAGSVMVTENGVGTMPLQTGVFQTNATAFPEKYLIMVNAERNNNKFYRMSDLGGGKWGAFYGRIGEQQGESRFSSHVTKPYQYPDYMFGIKLEEKLLKGYQDVTDLHDAKPVKKKAMDATQIKDSTIRDLINRLMAFADQKIKDSYTVNSLDVTPQMISAAKTAIDDLYAAVADHCTVEDFNGMVVELMHIIPRRIDGNKERGVQRMLAKASKDFAGIIEREGDLLSIMEGQVNLNHEDGDALDNQTDILQQLGIKVFVATDKQREEVMSHLTPSLKNRVATVYRVINDRTQAAFDSYLESHRGANGRKPRVKQFWHGSRNENWFSIMQKGLLLNPNAVVTGKMFGNGCYFASSPSKSWGYTSALGSRWATGNSNTAFMALYATAYGKPYSVSSYYGNWHGYNYQRLISEHPGCSCVFADSSEGMLHADEIVFYREDQMTINYLVEFKL